MIGASCRTPLDVALSRDGTAWDHVLVLEHAPAKLKQAPGLDNASGAI
jgi:hypothetical protein